MADSIYQRKRMQTERADVVRQRKSSLQDNRQANQATGVIGSRSKPTMQLKKGVPVNDDKNLEREADVMGARASSVGQLMSKGHGDGCNCASCAGGNNAVEASMASTETAQLTCDAGHKQHPKGPCPDSVEGKVARMQGKHGGGKAHGKAKSRPKKRQEKYDADALKKAQDRFGGGGGAGGGAGGTGAVVT